MRGIDMKTQKTWEQEQIDRYIKLGEGFSSKLIIILVANVNGKTSDYDDYKNSSVLSEYYTLNEFETLSTTYQKLGYEVLSFFNETDFMAAVLKKEIQTGDKEMLVINSAQTGTYTGRKSLIPAFCEHFKIMHTGSNPYVVSLCRDKFHSNTIVNNYLDNPLETYLYSGSSGWTGNRKPSNGTNVIAKLNGESASIGLNSKNIFIYTDDSEKYLSQLSNQYMQPIIVQPFISGYEIELPIVIADESFPLSAIGIKMNGSEMLGNRFLDYNARFYHTYDFYNFDKLSPKVSNKIKIDAVKVANVLGISGYGRIDFRITPSGSYYISDIATNPHITADSSYAFAFHELGYSYKDMLATQIGSVLTKYTPS